MHLQQILLDQLDVIQFFRHLDDQIVILNLLVAEEVTATATRDSLLCPAVLSFARARIVCGVLMLTLLFLCSSHEMLVLRVVLHLILLVTLLLDP